MPVGLVYLIGAGPGDPALLTLRGRDALGLADAVIYDHLVHPDILTWAPEKAERVLMGKVGHHDQVSQAEITRAIISRALEGRVVARVKGGDPSVFGRLGEEALALADEGIPFEIVPGVTAAFGAAAYAGIPLTYRDCAPCVTLVTGHRRTDGGHRPEIDWGALAGAGGTLAIYMGMKNLKEVSENLIRAGRPSATPVALVRRATWPDQEVITGTLSDIAATAEASGFRPPVVAIVGEVVALRKKLSWFERRPLRGKRILVTRAAHQAGDLSALLKARWARPVELPLIELRPCGHKSGVEAVLRRVFAYDWVIFSSANAVDFTFRRLDEMALDARVFGAARVCAVGPKTAEALAGRGIRADAVPEEYVAESLVETLSAHARLKGSSVLIPRAREAREVIPDELTRRGARVDVLALYENVRPEAHPSEAMKALREGWLDMVTLASSSAAKNYAALCVDEGIPATRIPCAVIGPATRETAKGLGLPVAVMSGEYTAGEMVTAMEKYFAGRPEDR